MKKLKAKFILFSLLAVATTSLFTSCEESIFMEIPESIDNEYPDSKRDINTTFPILDNSIAPTLTHDAIFNTVLEASKGKASYERGVYTIELTKKDLGKVVYNAIRDVETIVLENSVTISEVEASQIFCVDGIDCLVGAYTFSPSEFEFNTFSNTTNTSKICFELRPRYWVCII